MQVDICLVGVPAEPHHEPCSELWGAQLWAHRLWPQVLQTIALGNLEQQVEQDKGRPLHFRESICPSVSDYDRGQPECLTQGLLAELAPEEADRTCQGTIKKALGLDRGQLTDTIQDC